MSKIHLLMEVPTVLLDDLDLHIDGHFCIASTCLEDPRYYSWFKNRPSALLRPMMLDNGTHEKREPVSIDDLIEIAQATKPQVVFAPDILFDAYATMKLSEEFFCKSQELNMPWRVAFIPQGKDEDDLLNCYFSMTAYLLRQPAVHWIGMSLMDNRENFTDRILGLAKTLAPLPHHMLGLRTLDEIASWPAGILSMDTVKPIKAAYHNLTIEQCRRGMGCWQSEWEFTPEQIELCKSNINTLNSYLEVSRCSEE